MQPNTITLSVNHDGDDGTTAEVSRPYSRYDEFQNRSVYIGESHTLAARDMLGLYRTQPKTSGNFRGTAKSAVKFTRDYSVAGVDATTTLVVPGIVEVNFSFPVGVTPAETLELRRTAVAILEDESVIAGLVDQLMV